MRLSRAVALAAVPLGIALLSGCDKPAPSVSVFSGATSANVEALCWSFDAAAPIDAHTCLAQQPGQTPQEHAADLKAKVGVVPVTPDQTIGISVDPDVAANGWYPIIGSSRLTDAPVTDTYYRFQLAAADLRRGSLELRVIALGDSPDQVRGLWTFQLVAPASSSPTGGPTDGSTGGPTSAPTQQG
ncbi:MAG: hypothetical protein WAN48_09440 [Actinomycetes bacterium]